MIGARDPVNKAAASRTTPPLRLLGGSSDVAPAGPTLAVLTAVEWSARTTVLPKIARSMLSRLWKLSWTCGVRVAAGVVDVVQFAPVVIDVVAAVCDDATVTAGGCDWAAETGTQELRDVPVSSRTLPEQ